MAENKRLSSNLRSGAALVNESLGIIADALRPGERERDADPASLALPPATPPVVPATSVAASPTAQPAGHPPNNGPAAPHDTAVMAAAAAKAAGSGTGSSGVFEPPAGWPEEDPPGLRGGLLRDVDHG